MIVNSLSIELEQSNTIVRDKIVSNRLNSVAIHIMASFVGKGSAV